MPNDRIRAKIKTDKVFFDNIKKKYGKDIALSTYLLFKKSNDYNIYRNLNKYPSINEIFSGYFGDYVPQELDGGIRGQEMI